MTPCNGRISHYKPITLSARYMTRIPVGYQDPVGILATRFRSSHIDLQIRSSSDYLGLLNIPVRSGLERILEVIRSGPGFSGPESDPNRIYSGTLPSLAMSNPSEMDLEPNLDGFNHQQPFTPSPSPAQTSEQDPNRPVVI